MVKQYLYILIFVFSAAFLHLSCSDGGPTKPVQTFEDLIEAGWSDFSNKNYESALQNFTTANSMDSMRVEAYSGIGWSQLKLDDLVLADSAFSLGSILNPFSADIFAGWAFSLNARKEYFESNVKADTALSVNPLWNFQYGLPLDYNDLHILRAENYFLLGNFAESLAIVQILNTSFDANITTSSGRSALAAEIERLKGIL